MNYREEQKNENKYLEESVAHHRLDAIAEKQIYFYFCIMGVRSDRTFYYSFMFWSSFSISHFLDIFFLGLDLMFRVVLWPMK